MNDRKIPVVLQENSPASNSRVRLTVDVSPELNQTLTQLAEKSSTTKSEILRKAITLMEVAAQAREKGQKIALIDRQDVAGTEIVGI